MRIGNNMDAFWELFSHDADMGIRGYGASAEQAFEMAAKALTAVVINPERLKNAEKLEITLEEPGLEYLFYEWINHLIYEMDHRRMLFGKFEVKILDNQLHAKVYGERVNDIQEDLGVEVKGATFTELQVRRENNGWIAQCVVDI